MNKYKYEIAYINEQMLTLEQRLGEIMREVMSEWAERMAQAQNGKRRWLAMDSDGAVFMFDCPPVRNEEHGRWDAQNKHSDMTHITDSVPPTLAARTWRDSLTEVRCL